VTPILRYLLNSCGYNFYRLADFQLGPVSPIPHSITSEMQIRELISKLKPSKTDQPLIRIGPQNDGGYLVPDDLDGISACYSPGVSTESGFEKQLADRGMIIHLADFSVDGPATEHPNFRFLKKFIGDRNADQFITLEQWINDTDAPQGDDLLLQMDIEGYEYESLITTPLQLLSRFRIIVIEIHDLASLWQPHFFRLATLLFNRLLTFHTCVHIHPNNCATPVTFADLSIPPVMEFTFYRNDRFQKSHASTQFPHPLDASNLIPPEQFPEVILPKCWYE
jgi:hypothetical protein